MRVWLVAAVLCLVGASTASAQADKVTREHIEGVSTFARLETTIACGGATKAEALPQIKKLGFVSVINVREASEAGADMAAEEAAAKSIGLRFINIPFNIANSTLR